MTKKHYTQFTNKEHRDLKGLVRKINVKTIEVSNHFEKRLDERLNGISFKDITNTLKNSSIIEYNTNNNDKRILLRTRKNFDGYNLCMVYSVKRNELVTIWKNHKSNHHENVNMKVYNKDFQIIV